MSSLDLGIIGNGTYGALLDRQAKIVWCCLPRFDGDPVFYDLLNGGDHPNGNGDQGYWSIELVDQTQVTQRYRPNTAILETVLSDDNGNAVQITDFAPRFQRQGRMFRPTTIVRRVKVVSGTPRIVVLDIHNIDLTNQDVPWSFIGQLTGQPAPLPLVLKGRVVGPSFHFSLEQIDFGSVSIGFLNTITFALHNTSEVPMRFALRIPGDTSNAFAAREFQVTPAA